MKTALNENSTNGWNAQSNPFMLVKQFRKMRAVAAGITFPVKLLHPLLQFIGQGIDLASARDFGGQELEHLPDDIWPSADKHGGY